jgi:hypothetical protein
MTLIVNFYGGPGSGKSTTAAGVFSILKQRGVNAELVFEYTKTWAWLGRTPNKYDELYLLGKQSQREAVLYGKVDVLLTDRPLLMSSFYATWFGLTELGAVMKQAAEAVTHMTVADDHVTKNVFLERTKPFSSHGRYQTEIEARKMDNILKSFVEYHHQMTTSEATFNDLADKITVWCKNSLIVKL